MRIDQQQPNSDSKFVIALLIGIGVICIAALLVISLLGLPGTTNFKSTQQQTQSYLQNSTEQLAEQGNAVVIKNYDEIKNILPNQNTGFGFGGGMATRSLAAPAMDMAESLEIDTFAITENSMADEDGGNKSFSTTNTQVQGVDEADLIKTDGDYLYAVHNNEVYIISNNTTDPKIISTIELASNAQELYIYDNTLFVYGYESSRAFSDKMRIGIIPQANYTYVALYDTADKNNPTLKRELRFEGSFVQSRRIADTVYFITQRWNYEATPFPIPRLIENDQPICTDNQANGTTCPIVYHFGIPTTNTMTTVSAIPLEDSTATIQRVVLALENTQTIYMSENALYLTTNKYLDEFKLNTEIFEAIVTPQLDTATKNIISKIKNADSDILSDQEKIQKIYTILQRFTGSLSKLDQEKIYEAIEKASKQKYQELADELETTIIHKLPLTTTELAISASGSVPGTPLNQFSLDEDNGFLRIATTNNQRFLRWSDEQTESSNNLFILDTDLKSVGSIRDIAKGERIYSVRFMQNRAYMVTFEQIDPLFVIDVADPYNPQILGELKIPGFSNYLHPYDETTLIGIGQDTTIDDFDRVRTTGFKVSLFDVSDVNNIQEKASYTLDQQSSSQAQYDHHAFLFAKEKNLLVVPISSWEENPFSGALVFTVTDSEITRKGAIEHNDLGPNGSYYYQQQILRSLYIDSTLYTYSNLGLKLNDIETLEQKATLRFPQEIQYDYYDEPILFEGGVSGATPSIEPLKIEIDTMGSDFE